MYKWEDVELFTPHSQPQISDGVHSRGLKADIHKLRTFIGNMEALLQCSDVRFVELLQCSGVMFVELFNAINHWNVFIFSKVLQSKLD